MTDEQGASVFSENAYRSSSIKSLPDSPKKRVRIGDELQPMGSYADLIPYQRTAEDVVALQDNEKNDPEFRNKDWWWDHQRIRFLNGKFGLKAMILILPFTWILTLVLGGLAAIVWAVQYLSGLYEIPAILYGLVVVILVLAWMFFAFWIIPPTTNWLMSKGIAFFLKPFENLLNRKLDETLDDGCSEFNRITGQIRFALGRNRYFEAPFVEFDAYVERVIQKGGIFYRLMFVHRYTQKTFNQTWLSGIEASKSEVLALWDMLQRYMDVTQPLPDVPRLEPFRHLDPITREHDKKHGRNPRYWRDLNLAAWKENDGAELLQKQRKFPWGSRQCKLTPQLGKVTLQEYRQRRPANAWPI